MAEITVSVTTYNLKSYLADFFDDLLNQQFQDFDIAVYDDCSTDGTRDILRGYKEQLGDRLKLIFGEKPLRMGAKSRNVLIDSGLFSGKYIVFLDGDDRFEPNFLRDLYNKAESSQADITICAYDRVEDQTGHVLCREMHSWPDEIVIGDANSPALAFINTALWNKLFRREVIDGLHMPEFSVGEDASFLMAAFSKCNKLSFVDEFLIHYKVRACSVISNTPEESIYAFANELHKIYNASTGNVKNDIGLAAFIHIGLSMAIRAYDNPVIDHKRVIKWTSNWFKNEFEWFRSNPRFRVVNLAKKGVKGLGLWVAYCSYRIRLFPLFLWLLTAAKSFLHIDIKF